MSYGPLEPSNRLEYFLSMTSGGSQAGYSTRELLFSNYTEEKIWLIYPALDNDTVYIACEEIPGGDSGYTVEVAMRDSDTEVNLAAAFYIDDQAIIETQGSVDVEVINYQRVSTFTISNWDSDMTANLQFNVLS